AACRPDLVADLPLIDRVDLCPAVEAHPCQAWLCADEPHRPTERGTSIERALRPLQHFDTLKVEERGDERPAAGRGPPERTGLQRRVVEIDARRGRTDFRTNAADRDVGSSGADIVDPQRGHEPRDV